MPAVKWKMDASCLSLTETIHDRMTHACLQLQPLTREHSYDNSLHTACRLTILGYGSTTATSSGTRSWVKAWFLPQPQTRSSQPPQTCQSVLSNATMTLQASHQLGWLSAMALPAMIFQAPSQMCPEDGVVAAWYTGPDPLQDLAGLPS